VITILCVTDLYMLIYNWQTAILNTLRLLLTTVLYPLRRKILLLFPASLMWLSVKID